MSIEHSAYYEATAQQQIPKATRGQTFAWYRLSFNVSSSPVQRKAAVVCTEQSPWMTILDC